MSVNRQAAEVWEGRGDIASRRSWISAAWAGGLAVICRFSEIGREWTQDVRSSYCMDGDNASRISESERQVSARMVCLACLSRLVFRGRRNSCLGDRVISAVRLSLPH